MMKALAAKPYSALTFLNMFKQIHVSNTRIHTKDVDPTICQDDLYLIFVKKNNTFELAEQFDEVCKGDLETKSRYRNILTKLIDYSFYIMPSAIPISRIWKSIKIGSDGELK